MPEAGEWTPEDGDTEWWPDPERTLESYTDSELRFCPLYRRVQTMASALPYELTDAALLEYTREMIQGYLEDDGEDDAEDDSAVETKPILRFV